MKKYLIFNSTEEAQAFANKVSVNMGYPKGDKTLAYTSVIEHPTDGTAICLTCPKCHSLMTKDQIDSLIEPVDSVPLGFFPGLAG